MIFKFNAHLIQRNIILNIKSLTGFARHESSFHSIIDKHVHKIALKTCHNLYSGKESTSKWYVKSGPNTGLEVTAEYVDTKGDDNDSQRKTIVALHGCPGNYLDYIKLIQHFGPNHRLIVPNFPDFSLTDRTNCFWHSAEEKADYLRDVFRALNVRQIDCLVVHSSAIFPASYLWSKDNELNSDFEIKSLCLLSNPGPKWLTPWSRFSISLFVHLARVGAVRRLLRPNWSKKWTRRMGIRNQIDDYDSLALLLSTVLLSDTETVDKRLKELTQLKIPTLSVFSSKDRLFHEEIFYDLYRLLETTAESFDVYEEHQNLLIQKASDSDWLKVVDIRSGGHYVFSTHSQLVHQYIQELLQKVH